MSEGTVGEMQRRDGYVPREPRRVPSALRSHLLKRPVDVAVPGHGRASLA